jgi:hypothetical protein
MKRFSPMYNYINTTIPVQSRNGYMEINGSHFLPNDRQKSASAGFLPADGCFGLFFACIYAMG